MFADYPDKELEIQDGKELVGFAVAVDKKGNPCWLDFVISGGGQWQQHKLKHISQLHKSKEG